MSNTISTDQQEQSMEEILTSIRRIISEDGGGAAAAPPPTEPGNGRPGAAAGGAAGDAAGANPDVSREDPDADILDLIHVVGDGPAPGNGRSEASGGTDPKAPGEDPDADILELVHVVGVGPEPGTAQDKPVPGMAEEVSAATLQGLAAALAAGVPLGDGNKTIEQLVREMLGPILKDWLEANLPELIERIVREEAGRIAQRTG